MSHIYLLCSYYYKLKLLNRWLETVIRVFQYFTIRFSTLERERNTVKVLDMFTEMLCVPRKSVLLFSLKMHISRSVWLTVLNCCILQLKVIYKQIINFFPRLFNNDAHTTFFRAFSLQFTAHSITILFISFKVAYNGNE